jgi:predicted membrane channel-forming protein YqfA (hemolysin III family)
MVAGALISVGLYYALVFLRKKLLKLNDFEKRQFYSEKHAKILWIGFVVYFVGVVIYGQFL